MKEPSWSLLTASTIPKEERVASAIQEQSEKKQGAGSMEQGPGSNLQSYEFYESYKSYESTLSI